MARFLREYKVQWEIEASELYRHETGTQHLDAPSELPQTEVAEYLAKSLHGSIGNHAQMVSYEPKLQLVK